MSGLRSCLKTPSGLRAAAKASVCVGQFHPSYEIEAALARLSLANLPAGAARPSCLLTDTFSRALGTHQEF